MTTEAMIAETPTAPPIPMARAESSGERFVFIDGLRAIAAVSVMFGHLYRAELGPTLDRICPGPVRFLADQADHGVQIFFVISGFVIAYSLRNMRVNAGGALNFIIRRQLRLDPLYWLCLFGATVHLFIQTKIHADFQEPPASFSTFLLNAVYLQKILHRPLILNVSWTLCLEVQFYLLYIFLLLLIQRLIARAGAERRGRAAIHLAIMAVPLIFSLWLHGRAWAQPYFLFAWYYFALGAMVFWTIQGLIPRSALAATAAVIIGCGIWQRDTYVLWCPAIAAVVYGAWSVGGLTTWLKQGIFQYFGRISYSLYLVHFEIGKEVLKLGIHCTGKRPGPAVIWFLLSLAASIGVAHLLHVMVERPSMSVAAKLKPKTIKPA